MNTPESVPGGTTKNQESVLAQIESLAAKLPPERQAAFLHALRETSPGPKNPKAWHAPTRLRPSSLWVKRKADAKTPARERHLVDLLEAAGLPGLTDPETCDAMGLPIQTVSPLRGGLVKAGLVVHSNRYRPNKFGSPCAVWVLIDHADEACKGVRESWKPTPEQQAILNALSDKSEGLTDRAGAELTNLDLRKYRAERGRLKSWGLVEPTGEKDRSANLWRLAEGGQS